MTVDNGGKKVTQLISILTVIILRKIRGSFLLVTSMHTAFFRCSIRK